jgi:hypothetical protein
MLEKPNEGSGLFTSEERKPRISRGESHLSQDFDNKVHRRETHPIKYSISYKKFILIKAVKHKINTTPNGGVI